MIKIQKPILFISLVYVSLFSMMSCISKSVIKSRYISLGESYKVFHPMLHTSEEGIYFKIINDTIYPDVFLAFSEDGVFNRGLIELYDTQSTRTGVYLIKNDSILLQSLNSTYRYIGFPEPPIYYMEELTYVILNDSIIQITSFPDRITKSTYASKYKFYPTNHPVEITADDDIRNYSWMWESRKEWKAWKKAHGRK